MKLSLKDKEYNDNLRIKENKIELLGKRKSASIVEKIEIICFEKDKENSVLNKRMQGIIAEKKQIWKILMEIPKTLILAFRILL